MKIFEFHTFNYFKIISKIKLEISCDYSILKPININIVNNDIPTGKCYTCAHNCYHYF